MDELAMNDPILDLEKAAKILGISRSYAYKHWHEWRLYKVRVLKMRPNAQPRFYKSDLLKMLEEQK